MATAALRGAPGAPRRVFMSGIPRLLRRSLALFPSSERISSPPRRGPDHQLHVRACRDAHRGDRAGSPQVETIRRVIPASETQTMLDNIGLPYSGINLSAQRAALIGTADGEILIALKEGHRPTADYVRRVRRIGRASSQA